MHWAYFMTVQTLIWAVSAGRWRPHAIVFALAWAIAEIVSRTYGDQVPRLAYVLLDIMVAAACINWARPGFWRGDLDSLVVLLFIPEWYVYFNVESAYDAWWYLWAMSGVQGIALGPWRAYIVPSNTESPSHDHHRPQLPLA